MRLLGYEIHVKKLPRMNLNKEQMNELLNTLREYNYTLLEIEPTNIKCLSEYYVNYSDKIYCKIRNLFGVSLFVIDNEIRAMLGHIFEYDPNIKDDSNLQKAYGHFRRFNLDSFKIICDELDAFYNNWLKTHYKYDFRDINKDFMEKFARKYYIAKESYTNAQLREHVGSDRNKNAKEGKTGNTNNEVEYVDDNTAKDNHSVLRDYSIASMNYVDMLCYYLEYRPKIEKAKDFAVIKKICFFAADIIAIFAGIVSFF